MNYSTPGHPVHHQLQELSQTQVHWVGDAIQPSHPLPSPSPLAFNLFPASGSFQMSQLFISGGQNIGVSASVSVLPMNIQDWFPLGLNDLILESKVIPEWPNAFPYFLQFMTEFCSKELMIWVTASSKSCFWWLYRAFPSSAAKNIINLISVLTTWWCLCIESSLGLLKKGVCYDWQVLLTKLC